MRLSPFQARLAFGCFLLVAGATGANMVYFQDEHVASKGARAKSERQKVKAEGERRRRLALDDAEAARASEHGARQPVLARAQNVSVLTPSPADAATRLGRFAPTSHPLEPSAVLPGVGGEGEPRMPDVVRGLQAELARRGYQPGAADGAVGQSTRAAIMAYEHDQGLPLTAEPSEHLLAHMRGVPGSKLASPRPNRPARAANAEGLIKAAQQALTQLGYFAGKIDGQSNEETARAIREYEMDSGLVPSGRISAPLLGRLTRATAAGRTATR